MQEDMLVEFTDGMGNAIFVSHQWISPWHPDPELAQFQHLQGALKNIMSTSKTSIDLDPVIELTFPTARSISTEEFRSKALFIWYDYFSIPQINPSSWTLDDLRKPIEDALNSVAAYISRCHFFFVLQPVVEDPAKAELFGASTWASRGWCRLEKTVRELLPRNSYVVIRSATSFYVVTQASISFALAGPPGEGTFGRGEDKEKLCNVLTSLLKQLLLHHLIREDFLAYRSYLNLQSLFLRGFSVGSGVEAKMFQPMPRSQGSVETFLQQNGFRKITEVDQSGWSPLCYAVLQGDPQLVQSLLAARADPNEQTKRDHALIGLKSPLSVTAIASYFGHTGTVEVLLSARAELAAGLNPPMCGAALGNAPECIRLLCAAGDSPERAGFTDMSSLHQAALFGAAEAVRELLKHRNQSSLSRTLFMAATSSGGTVDIVQQLVEARADVNEQTWLPWYSIVGLAFSGLSIKYRFGARRMATRLGYHSAGATPLMQAIITGQYEGAAALLVAKAEVDVLNGRKTTALDLATEIGVPQFLMKALQGDTKTAPLASPSHELWALELAGRAMWCRSRFQLLWRSTFRGFSALSGLREEITPLVSGKRQSLWLLVHEAGEGGLAERTAKEVSGFLKELQGDSGSMASMALVDFGGRSAANFEVLLERVQTALIQAAVTAAKQSLPGATHEEVEQRLHAPVLQAHPDLQEQLADLAEVHQLSSWRHMAEDMWPGAPGAVYHTCSPIWMRVRN
eukprot:symbB.v1.2.031189.t1/scaffold3578.1/size55188/2